MPSSTSSSCTPRRQSLETYIFPSHRLQRALSDPSKTPLVLVACGSYSPITHMHLRMFEMAVDHVKQNMGTEYEVIGGYLSPVSDRYNKAGLASAAHRVRMCELACDETSNWLMVDPWEAIQPEYQPTAVVLDHIAHEINDVLGGTIAPSSSPQSPSLTTRKPARIMLLGGSDLLQTMSQPGVWSFSDLDHILGTYGVFVIERSGSNVADALAPLREWGERVGKNWVDNIHVVRQLIANDISSTRIRQFLRQGMSVQYLLPAVVIEYIYEHGLYGEHEEFRETRSSSMPPLCRLQVKAKAVVAEAKAKRQLLDVPVAAPMVRGWSTQRERTKLREAASVDEAEQTGENVVDDGDGDADDTRGRRPS